MLSEKMSKNCQLGNELQMGYDSEESGADRVSMGGAACSFLSNLEHKTPMVNVNR